MSKETHTSDDIRNFFAMSQWLDYLVLRPLSHIAPNWEATWEHGKGRYRAEPCSFAEDLNYVIELIAVCAHRSRYHDHEDMVAEMLVRDLNWPIQKKDGRWIGKDYASILEQGAFGDVNQEHLVAAASGRVCAALDYGQMSFDDMEDGHLHILAALLSIIIYHRDCGGISFLTESED